MTTIVFPGQGSQFAKMTKDFYDNFSEAKETFHMIENITKINISDIIFNDNPAKLNQTQFTQLSIFCSSISIFNVLKSKVDLEKFDIYTMLGHSLGEYSALYASGILSIEECSLLLKKRGELMQNAYPQNKSGMAALIGMDCEIIEKVIIDKKLDIDIANDNSPMQIVVSGKMEDLDNSEIYFKEIGVKKFIKLNVSSAFHSKLMVNAENEMNEYIYKSNFNTSKFNIISNYTGKLTNNINEIIENLSKQMSNRVRWVESINTLESLNENNIIEIGPGKVLSGLIKRISDKFTIYNIENISDIKKIENEF